MQFDTGQQLLWGMGVDEELRAMRYTYSSVYIESFVKLSFLLINLK